MSNVVMYHGSNRAAEVLDAIVGGGKLRVGFHLSPSRKVAENYGREVVAVYLDSDLNKAHVGLINKDGNYNKAVGNGIEVVLKDDAAVNELYGKLWDAEILTA